MDRDNVIELARSAYRAWGFEQLADTARFDIRAIDGGWRCWPVSDTPSIGRAHVLVRSDGEVTGCSAAESDARAAVTLAELDAGGPS